MKEQNGNGFAPSIAQAIEEMKAFQGDSFSLERINLAELERRTGVSRSRLRRLKKNSFQDLPRSTKGSKHTVTKLSGYTGLLDSLLRQGVKNSSVVLERLRQAGFEGGATIVKEYIAAHKHLIPAKRQLVAAQGNRGRRYVTKPGEAYQMDWGFTDVLDYNGQTYRVACFAMICHHCGQRYIEFFPNARQENLFIGMIHAFQYMGVPRFVLTDNMKSVVLHRDLDGHPVWQKDYEAFMQTLTFETKLCKPRHPFTKGKVERLVRFVKDNFLADRVFCDLTDLNWQALEWCNKQNGTYRRTVDGAPQKIHETICGEQLRMVPEDAVRFYCKNRHPSPICTRFEHHFHALKPHLHRRSFSDTLPENQRHLIALKRHPLWHMQKLCQLSQPAELRSTFFRNRNAVLCQDVLQLSNPLALSLEFFLSCVKVFHRLTLHLVVAGPFQF